MKLNQKEIETMYNMAHNLKPDIWELKQENGGGIGIITKMVSKENNVAIDITDYECW